MTFKYTLPFLCGLCFLSFFKVEAVKTYQLDINLTGGRKIVIEEGGKPKIMTTNGAPALIISDEKEQSFLLKKIPFQEIGNTPTTAESGIPAIIISDDFESSKTHFNLEGFSFNPSLPLKTLFHDLKKNYDENKYRTCMAYKKYVESVQLRKFKDGKEISVKSFSQEMSQHEFSNLFAHIFG